MKQEPMCRICFGAGIYEPGTIVDHIKPHRGDAELFFDPANLQSLCKLHHDSAKQQEERLGYSTQIGMDGRPVDPRHPGYK